MNEFGGWDGIEFKGDVQKNINRQINKITRALPFNANKSQSVPVEVSLNITTEAETNISLHSGLINMAHYEWAKKIIESSCVYIWNQELLAYESIIINEYDYLVDSKQEGGSVSIIYSRTVTNNTISR